MPSLPHGVLLPAFLVFLLGLTTGVRGCLQPKADLFFFLEHYQATTLADFNLQRNFVKNFIQAVEIGPGRVQAAVTVLNPTFDVIADFNQFGDRASLSAALDGYSFTPNTESPPNAAVISDSVLTAYRAAQVQSDTPKYAISVLSQNFDFDRMAVAFIKVAELAGVDMIVIAVGSDYGILDTKAYAPKPNYFIQVNSFRDLDSLIPSLTATSCKEVPRFTSFTANSNSDSLVVTNGTLVTFHCEVTGNSFPYVSIIRQHSPGWSFDHNDNTPDTFLVKVDSSKVMTVGDSDNYVCRAMNDQGSVEKHLQVTVEGKPALFDDSNAEFSTTISEDGVVSITFDVISNPEPTSFSLQKHVPAIGSDTQIELFVQSYSAQFNRKDFRYGQVALSFSLPPYDVTNRYTLTVDNSRGQVAIPFTATASPTSSSSTDVTILVGFSVGGLLIIALIIAVIYLLVEQHKTKTLQAMEHSRKVPGKDSYIGQFGGLPGRGLSNPGYSPSRYGQY